MAFVIADYVVETASNPGTGTVSLAGAATGRRSFVSAVGSGNTCPYVITDGTQAEWGIGTVTAGTPNTLARTSVTNTTAGSTSKLNFTGTVTVYLDIHSGVAPYFDDNGNFGVGFPTTVGARLHVKGGSAEIARLESTTARGGGSAFLAINDPTGRKGYVGYGAATDDLHVSNGLSADLIFRTADTDCGRFNSNGKFLIGTASVLGILNARQYIKPAGSTTEFGIVMQPAADWSGGTGPMAFANAAGTSIGSITATSTATSYNTSSDERLKTLIVDAPYDADWIDSIQIRQFEFKSQPGVKCIGAIAQELELVAPEAVSPGDGDPNKAPGDEGFRAAGVDRSALIWKLIQEVQHLRARVAALEAA